MSEDRTVTLNAEETVAIARILRENSYPAAADELMFRLTQG